MESGEEFIDRLLKLSNSEAQHSYIAAEAHNLTEELVQQMKARANALLAADHSPSQKIADFILYAAQITSNNIFQALGLIVKGNVLLRRGELQPAIAFYDEAQEFALLAGNPVEAARSQIGKIGALRYLGDYEGAIKLARQTAETLANLNELLPAAKTYNNLGACYIDLEQAEPALLEFNKACGLLAQLDSKEAQIELSLISFNTCFALCDLGRYHEALEYSLQACQIARHYELNNDAALYQEGAAICYSLMGNFNKALRLFHEARTVFANNGLYSLLISTEYFICENYLELGRYAEAVEQAQTLLILLKERGQINSWNGLRTYHSLGRALSGVECLAEATEALQLAQTMAEQLGAPGFRQRTDLRLAELYLAAHSQENAHKAESLLEQLQHNPEDLRILPFSQLLLAQIEAKRTNYQQARQLVEAALERFKTQGIHNALYKGYWQLAQICEMEKDLSGAVNYLEQSIAQLERLRSQIAAENRPVFLKQKERIYEDAIALALQLNDIPKAFELVERVKSRTLVELVDNQLDIRVRIHSESDRPLVEELEQHRARHNDLTRRLARWQIGADSAIALVRGVSTAPLPEKTSELEEREKLGQEVLACEKRIGELTEMLQVKNALYAEDVTLAPSYRFFDLASLEPDEVLIEYYMAREEFWVFIVKRDGVKALFLPGAAAQLNQLLSYFHLNLSQVARVGQSGDPTQMNRLVKNCQKYLQRLYQLLVGPFENLLSGYSRLRIVPHGPLHYLPIHALYRAETGQYLLEIFEEISYLPAARLLAFCRERAKNSEGAGALVFGYSGQSSLPGTLVEADAIAAILAGSVKAVEEEASLELFRAEAPTKQIIHLATHGAFREDAPLFSALMLEGGDLTAYELFNMNLKASLLTLSCCESGLGALGGGDEVVGLSRACLYAGVASLALSLWRVEDQSSVSLMRQFYLNLLAGGGKAAALRQSQLNLLQGEAFQHPFYWAPFILVGDEGKL